MNEQHGDLGSNKGWNTSYEYVDENVAKGRN